MAPRPSSAPTNEVLVNFLDLDPSRITFSEPKENKYNGQIVYMKYDGKQLFVEYSPHFCPFGVSTNVDEKTGKVTGYTTSMTFDSDYENDPYFQKALELDEFFIKACTQNSLKWANKPSNEGNIRGVDHAGWDGTWKRLVKYPYKKDKQAGGRIYQPEYAPRMDFTLQTSSITEYQDEDGNTVSKATFTTKFFDDDLNKISVVDTNNIDRVMPKKSRIGVVAKWTNITTGSFGFTMKPKAIQIQVYPSSSINDNEWLGSRSNAEGDEEEDEFSEYDSQYVQPVKASAAPPLEEEPEEPEETEPGADETEPEPAPEPVPAPAPVRATVPARPKRNVTKIVAKS